MCVPKNRSLCVESAAVRQNSLYLMPWPRYLIIYHETYKGQLWCDFKSSSMIAQQSGRDFLLLGSSTWWQEYKLYNGKLVQFVVQWILLKNRFLNSTLHVIPEKKEHRLDCHRLSSDDLTVTRLWMEQAPNQSPAVSRSDSCEKGTQETDYSQPAERYFHFKTKTLIRGWN